jgi:hypothetical protein
MDPWRELAVREDCRDAVRAWAELEGKSPQMAEDLVRRNARTDRKPFDWHFALGLGVRIAVWIVESWSHISRR